MNRPVFIGSNIYRGSRYGDRHPLAIPRVPTAIDLCRAMGWFAPGQYRTSPKAKPSALTGFHTPAYVAALQAAEAAQSVTEATRKRHDLGTLSNPVFPEMYRRPATAVGGGLLAAELVAEGGVVFNPGGGTHHGFPDRAAGFCFLNEPVITIQRLLAMGLSRILYIDIDAHHGDGVEAAFTGSSKVRTLSVHEAGRWPFTGLLTDEGAGAAYNCPVPKGLNDTEFDLILNEVILPFAAAARPEAIFLQCGADAVLEDPLSRLALSNNSHWHTVAALTPMAPRIIVSGGGGYNPWTVGRLWAGVWATLTGHEIPDRLPSSGQAIQASLTWPRKGRPTDALLTTLRDAPREGPIRPEIRQAVFHLKSRIAQGVF